MQALQEASPHTDAIVLSPRTMADALQDVIRVYPLPYLTVVATAVVCCWFVHALFQLAYLLIALMFGLGDTMKGGGGGVGWRGAS